MKTKMNAVICTLDGKPVIIDQVATTVDGERKMTGGHPMKVGEILASMLMQKKCSQFSVLKAYALATRLYKSEPIELDEGDLQGLRAMVEENETFTPLVNAQILKVLIAAKEEK